MTETPADVCRMAQSLAHNCGYAVFPCRLVIRPDGKVDKPPARPEREGGHGFHDATKDPDEIAWLWRRWPGSLIGIATGLKSDLAVVDVDRKHPPALTWWQDNHARLLPTRCYRTYSEGLHLHYRHRPGIGITQGKLALGVDTRGEGGYVICWFAYGLPCLDPTPPAAFPDWLHHALTYKPPAPPREVRARRAADPDRAIVGILRKLAEAREGQRNGMVFWCACRLTERGLTERRIEGLLLPVAQSIGLTTDYEVRQTRATIRSAMGRAVP
jgi:hypothetical protein